MAPREAIMQALLEACRAISPENGYATAVRRVFRHDIEDTEEGDRPSVRVRWAGTTYADLGSDPQELRQADRFILDCRPRIDTGRTTDECIAEFVDDVVRAACGIDSEIDGLVTSITADAYDSVDSDEPIPGAIVTATVEYAVDKENPRQIAG